MMWFPDSSPGHLALWLVLLVVLAGCMIITVVSVTVAAHIVLPGIPIMFSTHLAVNKVLSQPLSHVILTVTLAGRYHSLSLYRRGKWRYCLPKFSHPVLCLQASTQHSVCYASFLMCCQTLSAPDVASNTRSWWEKKQKAQSCLGVGVGGRVKGCWAKPWFTCMGTWIIFHFSPSSLHLQAGHQTLAPLAARGDPPKKGDACRGPAADRSLRWLFPASPLQPSLCISPWETLYWVTSQKI